MLKKEKKSIRVSSPPPPPHNLFQGWHAGFRGWRNCTVYDKKFKEIFFFFFFFCQCMIL